MSYWVYENWVHSKAMIHFESCGFCNHGYGIHADADDGENGQWLGPFDDRDAAWYVAKNTGQLDVRNCKVCYTDNNHNTERDAFFKMHGEIVIEKSLEQEREWIVVRGFANVDLSIGWIKYYDHSDNVPKELYNPRYAIDFSINPKADIVAYDVHFIFFDVWEKHITTWQATETTDIVCDKWHSALIIVWNEYKLGTSRRMLHEDYQTCIVYVNQVRLKNGSILKNHLDQVIEVASRASVPFGGSTVRIDRRRTVNEAQYEQRMKSNFL